MDSRSEEDSMLCGSPWRAREKEEAEEEEEESGARLGVTGWFVTSDRLALPEELRVWGSISSARSDCTHSLYPQRFRGSSWCLLLMKCMNEAPGGARLDRLVCHVGQTHPARRREDVTGAFTTGVTFSS